MLASWMLPFILVLHLTVVAAAFNPLAPFILFVRADRGWFGWAWGAESTVSVVDRSPALSFSSRPAAFGAEINSPILGYVIPLSSFTQPCEDETIGITTHLAPSSSSYANTGCPRLCTVGPHRPDPAETWIALVQRGQCEFAAKVREAQRLGARAVVVGGVDPELTGLPDTLINMYSPSDASDVDIPSTFITYDAYSQLNHLIKSSNTSHAGLQTLSLLITAEYSAWEWYSPIVTFVVILLLPSLLTFLTLMIHRVRASRAAQRDRAPEDVVHRLPWRVWTGWEKDLEAADQIDAQKSTGRSTRPIVLAPSLDLDSTAAPSTAAPSPDIAAAPSTSSDAAPHSHTPAQAIPWYATHQNECAICLCEFEKGDKVRVLPCLHIFHMEEVDVWLIKRKKLCPVCKRDVTEGEESHAAEPDTQTPAMVGEEQEPMRLSEAPDESTPLLPSSAPAAPLSR